MMGDNWECDEWQVCSVRAIESGGERDHRGPGLVTLTSSVDEAGSRMICVNIDTFM